MTIERNRKFHEKRELKRRKGKRDVVLTNVNRSRAIVTTLPAYDLLSLDCVTWPVSRDALYGRSARSPDFLKCMPRRRVLSSLSPGEGGRTGASTHLSTRSAIEFLSAKRILLVEFHRDARRKPARSRPIVLSSLLSPLPTLFSLFFLIVG